MGKAKNFWRTDFQIRSSKLCVIDSSGKMIGELAKDEAIKKAKEKGLSLIEIAPNANPPVAKIADFGKFRYQEEKKARAQSKGVKGGELKEVRFSPFIGEADFKVRIGRIKAFFEDKNKVRVVVIFKKPQMRVKNTGYKLIERVLSEFGDNVKTDMPPKFLGKRLVTIISYVKSKNKEITNKKA